MRYKLNAVVFKDKTLFVSKCIENSVASQGRTIKESLDNLKEALDLYYEDDKLEIEFENITLNGDKKFFTILED